MLAGTAGEYFPGLKYRKYFQPQGSNNQDMSVMFTPKERKNSKTRAHAEKVEFRLDPTNSHIFWLLIFR